MFDPKTNKFPYPEITDEHYLKVKKNRGIKFDETYPFYDTSKSFKRKQRLLRIILTLIVFPFTRIRLGLKVEGRKNLKKYRTLLKHGVISVSNHVHMFDYLAIMRSIRPFKPNVLVWSQNVNGENGKSIRLVGGIPIPDKDLGASIAYISSVGKLLYDGGWLHVYSEGSMWEYYQKIRPFKKGAAYFAIKYDRPIIPLAFSYREPNWIRKKIFKQIATFTLSIGRPIYADNTLEGKDKVDDLTRRSHEEVVKLAKSTMEENLYDSVFDGQKRIDYYTTEYGVGYKKSW